MSRKALFFDIDGTLLDEKTRQIPQSTTEALQKARALGHLVFVNTGRSYGELKNILPLVEADGWLCGCGTYLEIGGSVGYHRIMPQEQVDAICRAALACDVDLFLEGRDGCTILTEESRYPMGQRLRRAPIARLFLRQEGMPMAVTEKFCVVADSQSRREEFFRQLGPDITVIDRGHDFYECVPAGHSKATAIDWVLEQYGLQLSDAYVFGDSTNDISMFEHVPNAVLMGKHDRELEPYASFVTKNVEEDGIRYAMEELGLIPRAESSFFPLFVSLAGRKVLVAGAGTIGTRRAEVLAEFGAQVMVAAPQGSRRMKELADRGSLSWEHRCFQDADLEGVFLAVAATDDPDVNDLMVQLCRSRGILVNHAGDHSQCDWYFPGIARSGSVVAGITASGEDHRLAKKMTEQVQEFLKKR